MTESERIALAAHLHVQLRRATGRVTDTEWMARNVDYADEIVRLARATAQEKNLPELAELAQRLQAAMEPLRPPPPAPPRPVPVTPVVVAQDAPPPEVTARYVGRLRG
ncbi:MAG: hypothetical protein ACK4J1_10725 [Hylemonella sp.]